MKVIADAKTKQILGAAILGIEGDEAIHGFIGAMNARSPYPVLQRAMPIHPTVSGADPDIARRPEGGLACEIPPKPRPAKGGPLVHRTADRKLRLAGDISRHRIRGRDRCLSGRCDFASRPADLLVSSAAASAGSFAGDQISVFCRALRRAVEGCPPPDGKAGACTRNPASRTLSHRLYLCVSLPGRIADNQPRCHRHDRNFRRASSSS